MKISARNCLEGKVVSIKKGPVSTEVTLETAAGEKIDHQFGVHRQ